jgi:hypothetical protein
MAIGQVFVTLAFDAVNMSFWAIIDLPSEIRCWLICKAPFGSIPCHRPRVSF